MNAMRIGFAKRDITPPVGTLLAGYAGHRPCTGVHDRLWCKTLVLEQPGGVYALVALDLMCVDEALQERISQAVAPLGIRPERMIVTAIHSHAAPCGIIAGEGPLGTVNGEGAPTDENFAAYLQAVITAAADSCRQALEHLEDFQLRKARGPMPAVATERHTGADPRGELVVLQLRTHSGREVTIYNFPCHPTVMSAGNLLVTADLVASVEAQLDGEMSIFLNGAAGDISTRFTRRSATFAECDRLGAIVARQVRQLLQDESWEEPAPIRGIHRRIMLRPRQVQTEAEARLLLEETTARWQQAIGEGEDPGKVRILKSYVEGAGVSLEFSRTMAGIEALHLPVTVFRFAGMKFVAVPGELFSSLQPEGVAVIGYAGGYYRYIAPRQAYDDGWYEALAAILAPGEGENLVREINELLRQLDEQ